MSARVAEPPSSDVMTRVPDDCVRHLIDGAIGYAIALLSPDGMITTWSRGAERLEGYSADDVVGSHFSISYLPEDVDAGKPEGLLRAAAQDGHVEDYSWCRRKDNTRFFASVAISALRNEDRTLCGFAKIARDLTDRLEARRHFERMHLLEQRERIARDLHDGAIQSVFAVGMNLHATLPLIAPGQARHRIERAVDALDMVTRDLRAYVLGMPQEMSARELGKELVILAGDAQKRSGIVVEVRTDDSAVARLQPHAEDVLLLTREAVSNVVRHSQSAVCSIAVRSDGDYVVLEIADQGRGFDRDGSRGGLGLANARARATSMGAQLEVESGPAGTSMRFRLLPDWGQTPRERRMSPSGRAPRPV